MNCPLFSQNNTEALDSIAKRYQLNITHDPSNHPFYLELNEERLQLVSQQFQPFFIDLASSQSLRRLQQFGAKQLLAKAVGFKRKEEPGQLIDGTAGLGRDSLLLASLGYEITLIERSPILAALLDNALERAKSSELAPIIERMTLVFSDSKDYFDQLKNKTQTIYLDPMFPEKQKSALVKKPMQILQSLIGHGHNDEALLKSALAAAEKRVVIKRPKLSPPLLRTPDIQFKSKTHRFDVYLTNP